MNTDLTTTFKTALLCVVPAFKLNQLLTDTAPPYIHLTLLNSISGIVGNTFNITDECLVNLLFFGSQKHTEIDNSHIINATIKYLLDSERFSGPLV